MQLSISAYVPNPVHLASWILLKDSFGKVGDLFASVFLNFGLNACGAFAHGFGGPVFVSSVFCHHRLTPGLRSILRARSMQAEVERESRRLQRRH